MSNQLGFPWKGFNFMKWRLWILLRKEKPMDEDKVKVKMKCKCGVKGTTTIYEPTFDMTSFVSAIGWRKINGEWVCPLCNRTGLMYNSIKEKE